MPLNRREFLQSTTAAAALTAVGALAPHRAYAAPAFPAQDDAVALARRAVDAARQAGA